MDDIDVRKRLDDIAKEVKADENGIRVGKNKKGEWAIKNNR